MQRLHPRHATATLSRWLESFPVVVLTGARQVGKSTLAEQILAQRGGTYLTLDDFGLRSQAQTDPQGFVSGRSGLTVIDEVQLVPELTRAIKLAVDRQRVPGQFLLTGSANLLRLREMGDSLAGRSAWLELGPLTWAELQDRPRSPHLDRAFEARNATDWLAAIPREAPSDLGARARVRAIEGGMPATLGLDRATRRAWYDGYRRTFLERDLRQLGNIENLPEFARLMSFAALRTAGLLNKSSLATDSGLTLPTLRRYLSLLETANQFFELPPFHNNQGKRLVKTPKLYATDSGLVAYLGALSSYEEAAAAARDGALVETWAVNELLSIDRLSLHPSTATFWRTGSGREVDLLLERGRAVVAIELKASGTIGAGDTAGLRELRDGLGDRFKLGIVAHLGNTLAQLDATLCAVPLGLLLGAS